ncbi:MAG: ureidoglycolate lyase, partial [Bacteroidia bacterium]|nr:ureidoglycolate lyase [Bacteroidia bacterium]
MKLIRFGEAGREKPGILDAQGKRRDVSAFGEDFNEQFFGQNGIQRLADWLATHEPETPEVDEQVRWAAPLARPSKIVCIGLNYADHAQESNMVVPEEPVVFFKATSAIVGPYDDTI